MITSPLIREYVSTIHIIVRIFIANSRNGMVEGVLKGVKTGVLLYKILTLNRKKWPGDRKGKYSLKNQ